MQFFDEDCLCDYLRYRKRLDDVFFPITGNAIISRHSTAYADFWKFLQRLQKILTSKSSSGGCKQSTMCRKFYRLNVHSVNYRLDDFLRHRESDSRPFSLSSANLRCFHLIFDMYLDFLQKQKVTKIVNLRRDQEALPIAAHRWQLLRQLDSSAVVVVAGDTGCGKSTQVPQYLHHGQLGPNGQPTGRGYRCIAITQPRRIACTSLAARVSTEMLCELNSKVAYQVRFERSRTKGTQILFLTEGLLLRQMQLDPFLKDYDAVILDEVHERHWQTDCLLGLVKCLVKARPELRVVLMSATINFKLFSSFFNNCPIIEVPGRLFPIELQYFPLTPNEMARVGDRLDPAPYLRLLHHIDARYPVSEKGDLLIFLPGMSDIQAVMEPAKTYAEQTKQWIILALHSALSAQDQEKVFHVAPDGVRKCILSTNIAETSLTIDGIRFVADSGRVKELSWDASARMRCLKEFPISKASADQRKGRAGRTGPGVCFRFFSAQDYDALQPFSTPEIRRVPLETLVLQMIVMGLPDVTRFPFIESPEVKQLDEALERLKSHGALVQVSAHSDETKKAANLSVTPLGRLLADLPVEFSLGRILILASLLRVVEPVLGLVAGMAVQSPLLSVTSFSGAEQAKRMQALSLFESDHGDPFTVLNLFDEWIKLKSETSLPSNRMVGGRADSETMKDRRSSRLWCRNIGAQEHRFHEIVRLRSQFSQLLRDAGLQVDRTARPEAFARRHELNRARRTERIGTKRRRFLTLKDNEAVRNSDPESEVEDFDSYAPALRQRTQSSAIESFGVSVRDLELMLCHDVSGMVECAHRRNAMTRREILALKMVLAGGLYPHVAIGDSANVYRVANRGGAAGPGAEMVFHTRTKGFVTLHPNDVFVRNPDVLFPDPKLHLRDPPSSRVEAESSSVSARLGSGYACDHQLLMYMDLMETTRPFLVTTLRVPALPTLLLYCREVDTNFNSTRIVFDSWLEVCIADAESAQLTLATAVRLRTLLDEIMQLKLADCSRRRDQVTMLDSGDSTDISITTNEDQNAESLRCIELQRILGKGLTAFLVDASACPYTIRRLLAADVKQLFRRSPETAQGQSLEHRVSSLPPLTSLPPDPEGRVAADSRKGGYRVTDYLTINSLHPNSGGPGGHRISGEDEEAHDMLSSLNFARILLDQHLNACVTLNKNFDVKTLESDDNSNHNHITCEDCGEVLSWSGSSSKTVLLRHRKYCVPTK